MKLLTKNTDYAIRALMGLSRKPEDFVSSKEMSQEQKIPYEYLRKIFQQLFKQGLVDSKNGGRGGFRINKDPREIRIVDVINIFQGDLQLTECMFRKKLCHNRAQCVLRQNIKRIEKMVAQEFSQLTIQGLLDDISGTSKISVEGAPDDVRTQAQVLCDSSKVGEKARR